MRIDIHPHGFELSDDMRSVVLHHIQELLQGVGHTVNRVSVQLHDERGVAPRGRDRRCCIRVEFDDQIAIEDSDSEASFEAGVHEVCLKLMQDELVAHKRRRVPGVH